MYAGPIATRCASHRLFVKVFEGNLLKKLVMPKIAMWLFLRVFIFRLALAWRYEITLLFRTLLQCHSPLSGGGVNISPIIAAVTED